MAIKLYGTPKSRASRCLWMLEELGVPYTNVPVRFDGEAQTPEFLKINPNGRIPAIDDDGLILFESMAINLHLARKYSAGHQLWPPAPEDQSRAIQWSIWAMTEVQPAIERTMMNRLFLPAPRRVEEHALESERALRKAFDVLEGALDGRRYILGDTFTVADLNVYCAVDWLHPALRTPAFEKLDQAQVSAICTVNFDATPKVADWAKRCGGRPAIARVAAMG